MINIFLFYIYSFNDFNIYDKFTVIFCTEDGVLSGNCNLLKKNVDIKNSVLAAMRK